MYGVVSWFASHAHGSVDWYTFAGFWITLLGFGITIFQVKRARSAAEQVEEAVLSTESLLRTKAAVEGISEALQDLEEIRDCHLGNSPGLAIRRYAVVKAKLIKITEGTNDEDRRSELRKSLLQLSSIERESHRAHLQRREPNHPDRLLRGVTREIDRLQSLRATMNG